MYGTISLKGVGGKVLTYVTSETSGVYTTKSKQTKSQPVNKY